MTTTTNRSAALARMADLVARWALAAGVTPVTAEAHPRARDVFVAVEVSCAANAARVARAEKRRAAEAKAVAKHRRKIARAKTAAP